jgi:hypothetical protein
MNFKNSDMVRCKIIRSIVFNKQIQPVGTIIETTGWQARQMMGSANPSVVLMETHEPKPIENRDTEVVVSTPDPVVAATTAASKSASRPRKAPKKKPMFDLPEDE